MRQNESEDKLGYKFRLQSRGPCPVRISWCPLAPHASHAPLSRTVSPTSPICCPQRQLSSHTDAHCSDTRANHSLGRLLPERSNSSTSSDLSAGRSDMLYSSYGDLGQILHSVPSSLSPSLSLFRCLCVCDSRGRALVKKITVTCLAASSLMRPGLSLINRHVLRPGVSHSLLGPHEYFIPSAPLPAQQPVTLRADSKKSAATLPIWCGA